MKLEVWDEDSKKENKLFLKLEGPDSDGDIALVHVDDQGKKIGKLLYIGPNGVGICAHVDSKLGFPLDEEGRIEVRKTGMLGLLFRSEG